MLLCLESPIGEMAIGAPGSIPSATMEPVELPFSCIRGVWAWEKESTTTPDHDVSVVERLGLRYR